MKTKICLILLVVIASVFCNDIYAQRIPQASYGFTWKNGAFDSSARLPLDTLGTEPGRVAYVNGIFWGRDAVKWDTLGKGGGADGWGIQVAITDNSLLGSGLVGDPLKVDSSVFSTRYFLQTNYLSASNNLSDLTNAATGRINLGFPGGVVASEHTITGDGIATSLKLHNDEASPGANKVYGTDASGIKGWKDDPAGGGGYTTEQSQDDFAAMASAEFTYNDVGNALSINAIAWSKITGTPTTLAGYGITDPIVLTSGSYADPAWITSLAWAKITGAPTISGTNTGDVTLAGQNYLTIAGQVITANAVNLSGTHVTGTLAAARIAGTATDGFVATLVSGVPTWQASAATFTIEDAQDATGAMINSTLFYTDATPLFGINLGNANTWTADQSFPNEAYNATTWNGSLEGPTKDAIRDQFEVIAAATGLDGVLAVSNTTGRNYEFVHNPASNDHVRYLTPDNYGTVYPGFGEADRFRESILRINGVNPSGRPNYVWMFGYNNNSGGGRVNFNEASIHFALESHWEATIKKFEFHWPQVTSLDGNMNRIISGEIDKETGASILFFTSEYIDFRRLNGGAFYTAFAPNIFEIQHNGSATFFKMSSPTSGAGGHLTFTNDGTDAVIATNRHLTITQATSGTFTMPNTLAFTNYGTGYTSFTNNSGSTRFEFIGSDATTPLKIEEGNLGITAKMLTIPWKADPLIKAGSFELTSQFVNSTFLYENMYHDGTNYRLRNAGLGTLLYFNGDMNFYTVPTGLQDETVAIDLKFRVSNTGDVYMPDIDNDVEADVLYFDPATGKVTYGTAPGGGGGSGTVNTGAANRLAYYPGAGTTVDDLAAITASRALVSDANGLPIAATTTAAEIDFVNGVTSAIQTQLDGKQATLVSGTNIRTVNGNSLLGSTDLSISASLTSTQVAFGSGTNSITSEADFTYDAPNNTLTAGIYNAVSYFYTNAGAFYGGDGGATAPTFSFAGSTNTGLYYISGSTTLGWAIGGANVSTLDNTGKLTVSTIRISGGSPGVDKVLIDGSGIGEAIWMTPPWMTNPMTNEGDIIYGGSSGSPARLPIGTAGQVLKVNSGATAVEWATAADMFLNSTNTMGSSGRILFASTATTNTVLEVGSLGFQYLGAAAPLAGLITNNIYFNGTQWIHRATGTSQYVSMGGDGFSFVHFASGTGGTDAGSGTILFNVIGTAFLLPQNNFYLNFGDDGAGSTGYGFRDNAGTMEFKNSGGSWAAFGSGGGSGDMLLNSTNTMGSSGDILFPANTSNSDFRIGTMEFQSLNAGFNLISANVYNNGTNFIHRATGAGAMIAIGGGVFQVYTHETSETAGTTLTGTNVFSVSDLGLNISGGSYFNFTNTAGSTGYGFWNDGGVMKWKNSGGSWQTFGTGGGDVTLTGTQTLTNKRITQRIGSTASSSTPTPDADAHDWYLVTALAANATFGAPTGTPTDGQQLTIRIKDNGTARTLAWNAAYRASTDFALPTTTVISKTIYLTVAWNAADSKWDTVGLTQGF